MKRSFDAAITSEAQARGIVERFFDTRDESVFAGIIRNMSTPEDEDVFAIMRGSDNDMTSFSKALYLLRKSKLITAADSATYIKRLVSQRAAKAA